MILAHSQPELLRLKYEVEQYLATRPHDVDGRVLRDDVDRAIGTGPSSARGRRLGYVLAGTASLVICTALGISLYRSAPMTPAPTAAPELVVEAPKSSSSEPGPPTAVVSPTPLPTSILPIPPPTAKGASRLLTSDQPASAARKAGPPAVAPQAPKGPQPAPAATHMLTIVPVPIGGTIEGVDLLCGTKGSVCSVSYPEGVPVELHPIADPGFTFVRFLGDCAPIGSTRMAGARTCGAAFVRTAPQPTPEEFAKGQIQALLKDFCAAFEAIDPQAVQRVFPKTDMAALRRQLNKSVYKSVQCQIAGTVFLSLNPFAGTAKVQSDLKRVYAPTLGSEQREEQIVSMTLSRPEPGGRWYIDAATYQPKPK